METIDNNEKIILKNIIVIPFEIRCSLCVNAEIDNNPICKRCKGHSNFENYGIKTGIKEIEVSDEMGFIHKIIINK